MRAICTGYATGALVCASIFRLLGAATEWEILASGAIAALIAIAWRPAANNTTNLHGVWSASRSSDGKADTWQIQTWKPPEATR